MLKAFYTTLALLTFFVNADAQEVLQFKKKEIISKKGNLPYRLLYPLGYTPLKKYPLIVFLHGAGERGSDNEGPIRGLPKALLTTEGRAKYPCFILVPQCAKEDEWVSFPDYPSGLNTSLQPTNSTRLAIQAIEKTLKELPVDRGRIYLTGYSMGGEGTLDMLSRWPDKFAAGVPICSVSDTSRTATIAKIPLWFFHGDQDGSVNVKYSRIMVAALKRYGVEPRYTEYVGVGHNSWINAYQDEGLFDWLFLQSK